MSTENNANSMQNSESEIHYPDCPWSIPEATCGPDTCYCSRMRRLEKRFGISTDTDETGVVCDAGFTSGSSDSGSIDSIGKSGVSSISSDKSVKCMNCGSYTEKIMDVILQLARIVITIADKYKKTI